MRSDPKLHAFAARSIAKGSSSFAAASRLFDPATRDSVILLYAWCRHCDDVIDGQQSGSRIAAPATGAARRLETLREKTAAALKGRADEPVFCALAAVAERHDLPDDLFFEHLAGYEMDVLGRSYDDMCALLLYCHRVAGVVGMMMGRIMGVTDPATLCRAADLGLAFQLTNIARDLVDDARAGRVYVPLAWLAEEGIGPGDLADPAAAPAVARLRARLVAAAEPYYRSARIGIDALPRRSALAIAAALGIYRRIGRKLVDGTAAGPRAMTGRGEKLIELARAALIAAAPRRRPSPAARFAPPSPARTP